MGASARSWCASDAHGTGASTLTAVILRDLRDVFQIGWREFTSRPRQGRCSIGQVIFHRRHAAVALFLLTLSSVAAAQTVSGVVVDQTGLPLPGVQIEVTRGGAVLTSIVSGSDGTFSLP